VSGAIGNGEKEKKMGIKKGLDEIVLGGPAKILQLASLVQVLIKQSKELDTTFLYSLLGVEEQLESVFGLSEEVLLCFLLMLFDEALLRLHDLTSAEFLETIRKAVQDAAEKMNKKLEM